MNNKEKMKAKYAELYLGLLMAKEVFKEELAELQAAADQAPGQPESWQEEEDSRKEPGAAGEQQ